MIHVRQAVLGDAEGIARVQVDGWHAAYRGLLPDEVLDAFDLPTRHERWIANLSKPTPGLRTTVAERAGEILGFAGAGPSRERAGYGEIWALYAAPSAWGTGVGRALLLDGLAHLDAAGLVRSELWVLEGNQRAIRFYERGGYALDGERRLERGAGHLRMVRPSSGA